jgi:hypothetical protein
MYNCDTGLVETRFKIPELGVEVIGAGVFD